MDAIHTLRRFQLAQDMLFGVVAAFIPYGLHISVYESAHPATMGSCASVIRGRTPLLVAASVSFFFVSALKQLRNVITHCDTIMLFMQVALFWSRGVAATEHLSHAPMWLLGVFVIHGVALAFHLLCTNLMKEYGILSSGVLMYVVSVLIVALATCVSSTSIAWSIQPSDASASALAREVCLHHVIAC